MGVKRGISQNASIAVGAVVVIVIIVGYAFSISAGINTIIIRVQCSGPWTGNYGDMSGQQSVDGAGNQAFTIEREGQSYWGVTAVFQKSDWGNYQLTASLETPEGEVLESKTTTAEFGLVTVTWSSQK